LKTLSQFAIAMFGLLAGGTLLIAMGLVPYWQSLNPAEFTEVFRANLPTVGGTMAVLTVLGTVSMAVAAGHALWKKRANRLWLAAGAAATLMMVATVPFYFGAANPLLASGTLSAEAITAELATWQQVHWLRTLIGLLGLFCAVRAAYVTENSN